MDIDVRRNTSNRFYGKHFIRHKTIEYILMCHSGIIMKMQTALLLLVKLQIELLQLCAIISLEKSNFVAVLYQFE